MKWADDDVAASSDGHHEKEEEGEGEKESAKSQILLDAPTESSRDHCWKLSNMSTFART